MKLADIKSMISREENNPSVIMKDIMVAMPEGYTSENGFRIKLVYYNGDKLFWHYLSKESRDNELILIEECLAKLAL